MDKHEIITHYTDFLLEEGQRPLNVFKFCKSLEIEESEFYNHFGSFTAIEKAVFGHFFEETLKILHKSEDYESFGPKEKLLSFYYTYFENLTANRSLVVYLLKEKNPLKGLANLSVLKEKFSDFLSSIDLEIMELPIDKINELQEKGTTEAVWGQFLIILKYWLNDDSPAFEKTDLFIEKSTAVGFELMNFSQLESIIDFGKFLFKDKLKMS